MSDNQIHIGNCKMLSNSSKPAGEFVEIGNEKYYRIKHYNQMPDFFVTVVSDSDHWMFISSNGSLSAGRKDRDNALFPYYTVDKIYDYFDKTGSKTWLLVEDNNKTFLWEPFAENSLKFYNIARNIYKSIFGNKIIFEETNEDLGLTFRYSWNNSEKFGFVKKSWIKNNNEGTTTVKMLDGLQNIMPSGTGFYFQNEYSNLLDAYKRNERLEGSTLALYTLSSIPVDRAEPSESLYATTVWSLGIEKDENILVSDKQVKDFITGKKINTEEDVKATRGSYFVNTETKLKKGEFREWYIIAEVNQDSTDTANLLYELKENKKLKQLIDKDIDQGTRNLKKMVAVTDGFQMTNTEICYARHYINTLFNIMRGGVFAHHYKIQVSDYKNYVSQINKLIANAYQNWFNQLEEQIDYPKLLEKASETGDTDLVRITYEYLPLIFSRRHGDPSRPWNIFSIETKNEDGTMKFNYQGNWRDIFQNWEALSWSFPGFIEGIISKFVNASTIDGYNPYRIMRDGIDWERPDPEDPWAYIGYWGDHQIIYLQKLLEISEDFHPGKLDELLKTEIFAYANVPFRIKSYDKIVENPKDTVEFDHQLDHKITSQLAEIGADAKMLKDRSGKAIYKVNLTEKILATLLSKLSNFIPEAGIWLNTQRPEWNDANNALVGNGTSMVTLYYLRRFLLFWNKKFGEIETKRFSVSAEVTELFDEISEFLTSNLHLTRTGFSDKDRKRFADHLGRSHWKYRKHVYNKGFAGDKKEIESSKLEVFTGICLEYVDQSIKKNKRGDGLYHAYNLISINKNDISIRHLYEMLEGQVAVLSSGFLSSKENLEVLDSLKKSKMFREDQYSYMLYPDRPLARFTEKNNIPSDRVLNSKLLKTLVAKNNRTIITKDVNGNFHFHSDFRNADTLSLALEKLENNIEFGELVKLEKDNVLDIYEEIFDHQSFTGRSGTFYGYEGLGSIYWHMVSKLLLATKDCFFKAIEESTDKEVINRLKQHYYEIKAGIGLYKNPALYGSFPTDAYSHTPRNAGVKQPGLTGQVKEDIISRYGELGIVVKHGKIIFETALLNKEEILDRKQVFEYYAINGEAQKIELSENQLGFTFCQVPVIYTFSDKEKITVSFTNGSLNKIKGNSIDQQTSNKIFDRIGEIKQIEVTIKSK